jgi:hypothetical protein
VAHLPSLADFDYYFLFGAWFQYVAAAASALASVYGAKKSARSSEANARAQRAWQTEMSWRSMLCRLSVKSVIYNKRNSKGTKTEPSVFKISNLTSMCSIGHFSLPRTLSTSISLGRIPAHGRVTLVKLELFIHRN